MKHMKTQLSTAFACCAIGALATGALAYTSSDQNNSINNFDNVFYSLNSSGQGYYLVDTNRGMPNSSYFWTIAEEMEMVEDAYIRTRNPTYKSMIDQLYAGFVQINGTYWIANGFNDDNMWMDIACLRAYQITGESQYYTQAKWDFDNVYARAADSNLGGGLWWTTGKTSKNACVNGPAAIAAVLLYQCGAGSQYLTDAQSIFNWEKNTLYQSSGEVVDNITAAGTLNGGALTYNQGTFIGAADLIDVANGNTANDWVAQVATSYTEYNCSGQNAPGILWNEYVAGQGSSDGAGFKGIFARWCGRWMMDSGNFQFLSWMQSNAQTVLNDENSSGISWGIWGLQTPTPTSSSPLTAWECTDAVAVLQDIPPFTPITNGTYSLTPANATGSRLDAAASGTTNGTKVDIWSSNNGSNQKWIFTNTGGNWYKIQPSYNTRLCLDVYGANNANGTVVDLWQDNGSSSQRWLMTPVSGGYTLTPQCAPGLCLDVYGAFTANGTQIDIWPANGGSNQTWSVK